MGGYVGSYTTYKDNPTSAPAATVHNAFSYKNDGVLRSDDKQLKRL